MSDDIILLKDFLITKMSIECIFGAEDSPQHKVKINYKVFKHKEKEKSYRLNLILDIIPDTNCSGYKINTEILGFFDFPENFTELKMEYLIRVNGGTILYGILRGEIANYTGSFPGGKFVLPTVSMREIVRDYENMLKIDAEKFENQKKLIKQRKRAKKTVEKI